MKDIQLRKLIERLAICFMFTLTIQLMFSVSFSEQTQDPLNAESNPVDDLDAKMRSIAFDKFKMNRLFPSDNFFKELIRVTNLKLKAHPNYKLLHKFLKDLKKKKYDENFGEEEPYEDYSYQGKFRF